MRSDGAESMLEVVDAKPSGKRCGPPRGHGSSPRPVGASPRASAAATIDVYGPEERAGASLAHPVKRPMAGDPIDEVTIIEESHEVGGLSLLSGAGPFRDLKDVEAQGGDLTAGFEGKMTDHRHPRNFGLLRGFEQGRSGAELQSVGAAIEDETEGVGPRGEGVRDVPDPSEPADLHSDAHGRGRSLGLPRFASSDQLRSVDFMDEALALAEAGLGRVWPNPSVGCVIVQNQTLVGRGATQPGGRPHAEVVALADAGERARGATAYVSLEPCAHYGKTPPCAKALIEAGVAKCVVALLDPDPRVDGKGLERLRAAGLEVELGPGEARARTINEGFFLRVRAGRPLVTVARSDNEAAFRPHDARLRSEPDGSGIWAEVRGTGVAPVDWWVGGSLPFGSRAWRRFDCPVGPHGPEPAAVLGALGAHGLTRVVMASDDPFARAARAAGLADRELDDAN